MKFKIVFLIFIITNLCFAQFDEIMESDEIFIPEGIQLNKSNNIQQIQQTTGHNGKNKGFPLMRVPGNPHDDKYTDVLFKKTIAEPHFCYGHIQMLYNCTFIEGGN